MADLKISALTASTTPLAGTEVAPIVQSGTTKQVSVENIVKSTQPGSVAKTIPYLNTSKIPVNGTELQFDGTNMGVGLAPAAWTSGFKAIQLGSTGAPYASISQQTTGTAPLLLSWGAYGTGTLTFAYTTTGDAVCQYRQTGGAHSWLNAPSGTADGAITFVERMSIAAAGNILINTTTVGGSLGGNAVLTVAGLSGQDTAVIRTTSGSAGNLPLGVYNDAASGDNALLYFYTNATPAYKGGVDYNRAGNLIRYNTSSDGTLKNIIGDSDGSRSIEILKTTRLRDYTWKDDPEQNVVIGPIAQELYETYKGAVSVGGDVERERDITEDVQEEYVDENGDTQTHTVSKVVGTEKYTTYRPWAVDKTAFSFHLVAGWQAHEKTIAAQQELIEQLITRIEALEAK